MTTIDPTAEAARESAREAGGQFGIQQHTAPEAALVEQAPLTDQIGDYLREYDAAADAYEEEGDDGYESWEDFQTDNSRDARDLLDSAKSEIARLQAALAAAEAKHAIPDALRSAIDKDYETIPDEPLLFVPEDGQMDGYADVVAFTEGVPTRKYTLDPDGKVEWYNPS